jgi:dienelactone hydrolase
MGLLLLIFLFVLETAILVWTLKTRNRHREEKSIINLGVMILITILLLTNVLEWSFRYVPLMIYMVVLSGVSVYTLLKRGNKAFVLKRSVFTYLSKCILIVMVTSLAILFPQYSLIEVTGTYDVVTEKNTWIDDSRVEMFSKNDENRALTVDFWYPNSEGEKFPLIVFSHGAFGFSGSNYSTFAELASQGYIVASISHTYQAFFTKDTSGKMTLVDTDFINNAVEINAKHDTRNDEKTYSITSEWMKLRTDDENFVIETILEACKIAKDDSLFSSIDTTKIGLMGHSLGGATSAQMGRLRDDIDAVIILDGTMLGEEIDFVDHAVVLNDEPYPVPLLNIYAQDHYENAKTFVGDSYNNFYASENAIEAYETVFSGAGHLNFTDLPIFSPALAKMLGVGEVDERICLETMNTVILEFFNAYLKNESNPIIAKEY